VRSQRNAHPDSCSCCKVSRASFGSWRMLLDLRLRSRMAGATTGAGEKRKPIRLAGPTYASGGKSASGRRGPDPHQFPVGH
jgi:hypothetical protein